MSQPNIDLQEASDNNSGGNAEVKSVELKANLATNSQPTNYRWVILGFAFFITLVNYLDRTAISYAMEPMKKEFGFNHADFGSITAAFGVGYMIMTTGGGIMVDKWGARKVWSIACILWSGCTAMMGKASNLSLFCTLRTLLGLSEGPHFPSLTRVVADWLPTSERARSTAIGLAAVPLANAIGAPLLICLLTNYGWKNMFVILGAVGIVWAVVWWLLYRDYPEHAKFVNDAELLIIRDGRVVDREHTHDQIKAHDIELGKTTWKFLLTNKSLVANNFAFFAFGYLLFFAVHWLPDYLCYTFHVKLKVVADTLWIPWLVAAVMVSAAGFISDKLYVKTGSMRIARSHVMWICQLLSAISFIPILFSPSIEHALVFLSLGLGFGFMPNASFYAINCDLAKDKAATSLGLMDSFLAFAGIIAPYLTGVLVEKTKSYNSPFMLLIAFTLCGVIAVAFFQNPDRDRPKSQLPVA